MTLCSPDLTADIYTFREEWGNSNLHTVLCKGRNRPLHVVSFVRSFGGTYCYLLLYTVVLLFPGIVFGLAFFLFIVSSTASWNFSQAQIWSDGSAPKRADERRRLVMEYVAATVFWMGTASGSWTESCVSKLCFEQPKGRRKVGRCI